MPRYDAPRIESFWQRYWDEHQTFATSRTPPAGSTGKLYVLDMFPYPSGAGLHVGHPEGYTATDIVCRCQRMRGRHVLHPMGWDAFGLPAEEHAVRTGTHPRITTAQNISTFRRQLKSLGFSYDWTRELSTTDPEYYRWTQWIFLQLFDSWYDPVHTWTGPGGQPRTGRARPIAELPIPPDVQAQGVEAVRRFQDQHRLAYLSEAPVNWCPALGTVLANEEVIDGRSERGGHPVERIPLKQWMLRITAYAERLLDELSEVDWPESIKLLQRNWIGRSTGAEVDFFIGPHVEAGRRLDDADVAAWRRRCAAAGFTEAAPDDVLRVYTTRPDTLFGATFMVLAPEHPAVDSITSEAQRAAVAAYRQQAARKSDLDRTDLAKDKTGVFTGGFAVNPASGRRIPVWIADYVLLSYGTGAIMAVPAHDERDLEFAETFGLEVINVVQPPDADTPARGFTGEGVAIESGPYDGLATAAFKQKITADLARQGLGREAVNYRLRDWLFSRQRYWGEPFPIWHELDADGQPTGLMRADAPEALPILHPHLEDFRPSGRPEPMLAKAPVEWLEMTAPDGVRLRRETNTMPQWAGSCWYYLRFADPSNRERLLDPEIERYWLPVDLYIGGAEHAVLHLLYARFWHKVLFDRGHVSSPEPFRRLVNQGMILGEAELTGYARLAPGCETPSSPPEWVSLRDVVDGPDEGKVRRGAGEPLAAVRLTLEQVEKKSGALVLKEHPEVVVESRAFKMSKSRGNVINPDDVVREYGADSLRLYEMFMGPLEQVKPWSMSGVEGVHRFLGRVWRMIADERAEQPVLHPAVQDAAPTSDQDRLVHRTIKSVTEDIDALSFNTAISRMMEFTNAFTQVEPRPRAAMETIVLLLSPFAPHLAEELWRLLGHPQSLAYETWPVWDPAKLVEALVEIPVQINGKVRAKLQAPADVDKAALQALAEADPVVQGLLAGRTPSKVIVVPGRMVNFVVAGA